MEQLIFVAVIIFFSILESIAKRRRQAPPGQLPPEQDPAEWEWQPQPQEQSRPRMQTRTSEVPSYDDDPSFDVGPSSEGRSFDEDASSEPERARRSASSESMIPADIWKEIEGLARESEARVEVPRPKPQPRPMPVPRRSRTPRQPTSATRPTPKPITPRSVRVEAPPRATVFSPEGVPEHAVHVSHAGFGTDPSARTRSAQDGLDPLAASLSADAAAVRAQLRAGSAHALRQAIILQEVLGPPAAMRSERF